jgi:hypothetical protein
MVRESIRKMEYKKEILIEIFCDKQHLFCALLGITPNSCLRDPGFKYKPKKPVVLTDILRKFLHFLDKYLNSASN